MIKLFVAFTVLTATLPATAQNSFSANLKVQKEATIEDPVDFIFGLRLDDSNVIRLGCDTGFTTLEWPNLRNAINERPIYNLAVAPTAKHNIEKLTGEDFYCDTLAGTHDDPVHQVALRLTESVGKKVKIVADVHVTILFSADDRRTDVFSVTKIEFFEGNKLLASYAGRPSNRERGGFAGLTGHASE